MLVCTLASGSQGNCTYIKDGETEILIDAGISGRAVEYGINALGSHLGHISAIFVTHEHVDHVKGIEALTRKVRIPVVMNAPTADAYVGRYNPACAKYIKLLPPGRSCGVGSLSVRSFPTPHDSAGSMGFVVENATGAKAGVATDIGHVTAEIRDALLGCHTVVIESNHDEEMLRSGPYPEDLKRRILSKVGHLSNRACAELLPHLAEKGARNIVLYHLSQENNLPEMAYEAAEQALAGAGYDICDRGGVVNLFIAPVRDVFKAVHAK